MKRFFLIVPALILCCCLVSCSSKDAGGSKLGATAQKNLDASHEVSKMFESKDFSKLGDYIATDAVDHAGERGDVVGLENIRTELTEMCKKMTDMKSETVKEFADDDYVFSWMKQSATMTVADMGMPAGTKYTINAIEVSKFKDGKATEHWTFVDAAEMMKMMSQQQPQMENKADTTKKM